jgi:hypothetical protein
MKKTLLISVCLAALAGLLVAQKSGILHPDMTVATDAGTYEKPAGTLGDKVTEPWSATTVAAGVDKKPQPGKRITVTGEIIDLSCYLQVGKHGEKHKSCGVKCLQNNQPIGLLTKNGAVYLLMEEEHDPRRDGQASIRQAAIDNFAKIMEVTGTETDHGGYRAIFVQGYVKK